MNTNDIRKIRLKAMKLREEEAAKAKEAAKKAPKKKAPKKKKEEVDANTDTVEKAETPSVDETPEKD